MRKNHIKVKPPRQKGKINHQSTRVPPPVQLARIASSGWLVDGSLDFTFDTGKKSPHSLPLVAFPVVDSIANICIYYGVPVSTYYSSFLKVLILTLISCAVVLAEIGIIKAFTRHVKKEATQLFFIFLCLLVVEIPFTYMRVKINDWVLLRQPINSSETHRVIVSGLINSFGTVLFYLVLRLLFTHDRRQAMQRFFASIKAQIQKSIE